MTEKQINKWLRRRFSLIGWVLLGYYALMNLLVWVTMAVDMARQTIWSIAAGDYSMQMNMDAIYSNAWGYICALAAGLVILWSWKGTPYWKEAILKKQHKMKPSVFLSMMLFSMGAQMANSIWVSLLETLLNQFDRSLLSVLESVSGSSDSFSMFLYASILAPIAEELLFRGFVFRSLRPYGKRFAIFGSAVLFGVFHGNLIQTPYAVLMGLLLGYLTEEYSFIWAVALHLFNNLILAEGLTRLTGLFAPMTADALQLALLGAAAVLSVQILAVKRHAIREYRRSEWLDRRCVKCLLTNSGFLILALIMAANMLSLFFV